MCLRVLFLYFFFRLSSVDYFKWIFARCISQQMVSSFFHQTTHLIIVIVSQYFVCECVCDLLISISYKKITILRKSNVHNRYSKWIQNPHLKSALLNALPHHMAQAQWLFKSGKSQKRKILEVRNGNNNVNIFNHTLQSV